MSWEHKHFQLIEENKENIENMLNQAILELLEIAKENEIYLVDRLKLCHSYEDIFNYLKHRTQNV